MEFKTVHDKENKALIEFITSYGDGYDALLLQMLINDFSHYKGKKGDLVASVRSFLNLNKDENDRYKGYFEFLKGNFDLSGNVLEIACGPFPTLSVYVDEHQSKSKKGTIEAYDPLLAVRNYGNIKLNKRNFNDDDSVDGKDFAFASGPCKFTKNFITIMNENNIPYSVLLCPYVLDGYSSYDKYTNDIIEYATKTSKCGETKISYLDESYDYNCPIIYNKR